MISQMRVDREFIMEVVKSILTKRLPIYANHLGALKISDIDDNLIGFYVKFAYDKNFAGFGSKEDNKTIGSDLYIDVDGMKNGLGCLLYIDSGRIDLLECFSHAGEEIPHPIKGYCISEL